MNDRNQFKVLKKAKPVYIKWLDHFSHFDSWSNIDRFENTEDGLVCETLGWLCAESKRAYAVSLCYTQSNRTSCDSVTILKSCVLKKRFINL